MATALIVGSSDGIGLALARTMLAAGWRVIGISRSASPIDDPAYTHTIADVTDAGYRDALAELVGDDSNLALGGPCLSTSFGSLPGRRPPC